VSCVRKTRSCRAALYLGGVFSHYVTVLLFVIQMTIMLKPIVLLIDYVYVGVFFVKIYFSCICFLYLLYQLGTKEAASD